MRHNALWIGITIVAMASFFSVSSQANWEAQVASAFLALLGGIASLFGIIDYFVKYPHVVNRVDSTVRNLARRAVPLVGVLIVGALVLISVREGYRAFTTRDIQERIVGVWESPSLTLEFRSNGHLVATDRRGSETTRYTFDDPTHLRVVGTTRSPELVYEIHLTDHALVLFNRTLVAGLEFQRAGSADTR